MRIPSSNVQLNFKNFIHAQSKQNAKTFWSLERDVWLRESNLRNFVLSVLYVHPCFLYEDTLLHVMSKLLNVQFHIVTKDFSYTFSSSE